MTKSTIFRAVMLLTVILFTSMTAWADANNYDPTEWAKMEAAGCVFLPAAGYRLEATVYDVGFSGKYWSSSAYSTAWGEVYYVDIKSNHLLVNGYRRREYGYSVRLVRNVQ